MFINEKGLLEKVARGNQMAFKKIYELIHPKVYMYLYNLLQDETLAKEALVDTFVEVWLSAKNFRGKSQVSTWIIGIARNVARNKLKKCKIQKRHSSSFEDYDKHLGDEFKAANNVGKKLQYVFLKKAISRLSTKHREVIELAFYHGMSYKEISQLIGIPVNTVKTRIFHAKDKIKEILGKMGVRKDDFQF